MLHGSQSVYVSAWHEEEQVKNPLGQTPKEHQDCRGRPLDQTENRSCQDQLQAENQPKSKQRAPGQGWREDRKKKHSYLEALQGGGLETERDGGQDRTS